MTVPGIVHSTLDGEEISTRVPLGGEDELYVTPSRSLIYRAEGLLSDESVEEFPHDADRLTLSEGRRKTTFTLEYALDGTKQFTIPAGKTDEVLRPVIAGLLNGNGITDPGETVIETYRFSELTLVVTSDRLVKHIGEAVWDGDYEEYHYDGVTQLDFEDGSVATQIVLTVDGRPQRIKAPNEEATDLRERLQRALFEYHDVESLAELNATLGEDDEPDDAGRPAVDFGDGVDPLDADPPEPDDRESAGEPASEAAASDPLSEDRAGTDGARATGAGASASASGATRDRGESEALESKPLFDDLSESDAAAAGRSGEADPGPSEPAPEVLERLESLETAVERQSERIEEQQRTIERLIDELRQGR